MVLDRDAVNPRVWPAALAAFPLLRLEDPSA